MDTYGLDMTGRRRRRRYSGQFKSSVVQECQQPGVSMAAVALRHGLNANMVRKWVIDRERCEGGAAPPVAVPSRAPPAFVPLELPGLTPAPADGEIRIEVRRATTTVTIAWPVMAASDCAVWLREWLR